MAELTCSGCGGVVHPHIKYLCVYLTPIGFNLAVGCTHVTPPAGWNYLFGGSECFNDWIRDFEAGLRTCAHNGNRERA